MKSLDRLKRRLGSLSFGTGVAVLLCCIPFYILSFAQMLLPISVTAKGVLWAVLFGLAKTCQYGGLTILGVEGYNRLKRWLRVKRAGRRVRPATRADVDGIMPVIAAAKGIMRSSGNLSQWQGDYPSAQVIGDDIDRDGAFVVTDKNRVVGYFALLPSPEPTYAVIEGGQWLDDTLPYHVIHRMAGCPDAHHLFADIVDYCLGVDPNLRIDTHRDNVIMRHNIDKHGFTYCGIIYLANGDERLAYQKILHRVKRQSL